jgi:hypothetical protein
LIFFNDFDGAARFAAVKAVVVSHQNFPFKIDDQQIALVPDVDMHRFMVIGVNFELKTASPQNRRHNK